MANTLSNFANLVRGLATLAFVGLVGGGGWVVYHTYNERIELDRALAAKTAEIERLEVENDKLSLALRLLKVDHRVAQIDVVDQRPGAEHPTTKFRFTELTGDGQTIGKPKEFTIDGDVVYVDAWVIKYSDDLVEKADPLRSTSVCLFRRVFGEHQQPSEGFAIDAAGSRPAAYSQGNEMSPAERDIWANFWSYANDSRKAERAGVRTAHGEAPSIRLVPGKRYRIELRASAGLSIVTEDVPADRSA
jgi:hypothetical protein